MFKSVKTKVLAILLSLLAIYGFVVVLNLKFNEKKDNIYHFSNTVKTLQVNLLKDALTINDFFINDAVDNLFYTTNYSSYIQEHTMYSSAIKNDMNTLLNSSVITDFNLNKDLNDLNTLIQEYHSEFIVIVDSLKLNYSKGLKKRQLITQELTNLKSKLDDKKNLILTKTSMVSDDSLNKMASLTYKMQHIFEITAALILIIGIILSIIVAKQTTKKLILLSNTIAGFVKSKFTNMEDLSLKKSRDEIGQLVKNFLLLREEVYNQINFLEKNIEKRTRQMMVQNIQIKEQNEEIMSQRDEVLLKSSIIEKQNKSLLDSISYAKRIQLAVLPDKNSFKNVFPESFIIWKPKAVVSGDFYWFKHMEHEGKSIVATVDCTGHGVPGAFMSMLGNALLNEIILRKNNYQPDKVLNLLRDRVLETLHTDGNTEKTNDGMDMALLVFDHKNKTLEFAGAKRPLYIVRNNEMIHIKGDKWPIGLDTKGNRPFTNQLIKIDSTDSIYIFSDGYADQFNEENKKKFLLKYFKEMILANAYKPMNVQEEIYNNNFNKWKGCGEQTDDVLFIGLKIPGEEKDKIGYKQSAILNLN